MRNATKASLVVIILSVGIGPAAAHPRDLMTPRRAGPIVANETTMSDLRSWFGPPDERRGMRVGCIRILRARWNPDLTVYLYPGDPRIVGAVFVRSPSINSDEHGELAIHTGRGLRVGDPERKLRRLYPNADPETHAGHTHYRLRTNRDGSYLMAKVIGNTVVRLELWPLEFC